MAQMQKYVLKVVLHFLVHWHKAGIANGPVDHCSEQPAAGG